MRGPAASDQLPAACSSRPLLHLGFPTRLLRYSGQAGGPGSPTADPQRRQVEPEWGLADGTSSEVAFADGFPYLLANEVTSLPTHKGGRGSCFERAVMSASIPTEEEV